MSVLYAPTITETQRKANDRHRSFATAKPSPVAAIASPVKPDAIAALLDLPKAEAPSSVAPLQDWVERQRQIHPERWFAIEDDVTIDPPKPRVEDIQRLVASNYNVTRADMMSARRTANIVRPRQVAMYLAKTLTPRSLPEIGRLFGNRDHTTILHAVRKISALAESDAALGARLEFLKTQLREGR